MSSSIPPLPVPPVPTLPPPLPAIVPTIIDRPNQTGSDGPRPWERTPNETDSAWLAFSQWLGMEPRSVTELSRRLGHKSHATCSDWSRQHAWDARGREHDAHVARLKMERKVNALAAVEGSVIQASAALAQALEAECLRLLAHVSSGGSMAMTPREVAQLLEVLTKIQRLYSDRSTSNVAVRDHDLDLDALDAEELLQLSALISKGSATRG